MCKDLTRVLLLFFVVTEVVGDGIRPFRAEYVGTIDGMSVKAEALRELVLAADGSLLFTSSANLPFISAIESSKFTARGNSFIPLQYRYQRNTFGKKDTGTNSFDWEASTTTYTRKKGEGTYSIRPGTLDKLLYQLQLRADARDATAKGRQAPPFKYVVADNDDLEEYTFIMAGQETLTTPMGEFDTTKFERVRQDSDRHTTFWLARDHDYLLVRLKQTGKNERSLELNLVAATIDGRPLERPDTDPAGTGRPESSDSPGH